MALQARFKLAVVGALFTLAACGGGAGRTTPATPIQSKPSAASAALSFFVPSAGSAARAKRPSYLPSNTASVVITVLNSDGTQLSPAVPPTVANVGSTAPGCSSVSGGLQCVVSVTASTGSILFSVTAYDAANGAGNVLSSGSTVAAVGSGPNNVSITLAASSQYGSASMGGGTSVITINHQTGTFNVQNTNNSFTTSGTYTNLPNGDMKFVVQSSTDTGVTVGEVAYARELAGGAMAFVVTNSTAPNATGESSGTNVDWGVGTVLPACATSNGSFAYAGVSILGPSWAVASSTAYTTGAATVTPGALTFVGTNFLLNGTNNGPSTGGTQTCTNGIYSETNGGSAIPGSQGFIVVADTTGGGGTPPSEVGGAGFIPSASVNLAALASQSYEVFEGTQAISGTVTVEKEQPFTASPGAANVLTVCPYLNFEANSVDTSSCATVTFGSQLAPGLITGTATRPAPNTGTDPFVAAVGTINGKYVIVVISGQTSGAVNLVFMQH